MLMDPHRSQQHAGLKYAVWRLHEEVTRPKAYLAQEVWGGWGSNQLPTYLGQLLQLYSQRSILLSLIVIIVGFNGWFCNNLRKNSLNENSPSNCSTCLIAAKFIYIKASIIGFCATFVGLLVGMISSKDYQWTKKLLADESWAANTNLCHLIGLILRNVKGFLLKIKKDRTEQIFNARKKRLNHETKLTALN